MQTSDAISNNPDIFTVKAANLSDPVERAELALPAMKAFLEMSKRWNLSSRQARALLGGISSQRFARWSSSKSPVLSQDTLTRVSLLLGIYRSVEASFGEARARKWVTLGNRGSVFSGRSPFSVMSGRGIPGMLEVRRILDDFQN